MDLFPCAFYNILALDKAALYLLLDKQHQFAPDSIVISTFGHWNVDPSFFRHSGWRSAAAHYGFLFLMVINLVSGFHALGTLMAIGIMILPAAAARFWYSPSTKF